MEILFMKHKYVSIRGIFFTVKPVCNDHLCNKIYYLWFIQ